MRSVEVLREMGLTWPNVPPVSAENQPAIVPTADAMHRVLVEQADRLVGCVDNSDDEADLIQIRRQLRETRPTMAHGQRAGRRGLMPLQVARHHLLGNIIQIVGWPWLIGRCAHCRRARWLSHRRT